MGTQKETVTGSIPFGFNAACPLSWESVKTGTDENPEQSCLTLRDCNGAPIFRLYMDVRVLGEYYGQVYGVHLTELLAPIAEPIRHGAEPVRHGH